MEYTCTYDLGNRSTQWTASIEPIAHNRSFFEVNITGRGSSFHVIAGPQANGHFLCIPDWHIGCELAAYNDIFWNSEQIRRHLSPIDTVTIALGLPLLAEAFKRQHDPL